MQDFEQLITIQDAISYLNSCITRIPITSDKRRIATRMVGIHHSDHVEEWYDSEPLFQQLLDRAETIEVEGEDSQFIEQDWDEIQSLLAQLNKKYL